MSGEASLAAQLLLPGVLDGAAERSAALVEATRAVHDLEGQLTSAAAHLTALAAGVTAELDESAAKLAALEAASSTRLFAAEDAVRRAIEAARAGAAEREGAWARPTLALAIVLVLLAGAAGVAYVGVARAASAGLSGGAARRRKGSWLGC